MNLHDFENPFGLKAHFEHSERGELCLIGRLKVSSYFYDATLPKGSGTPYKVVCPIPGIRQDIGNYATVEEAKERCVRVAATVIKLLTM